MASAKGSIQVAYLYGDFGQRVSHSFHQSMHRMFLYDRAGAGLLADEPIGYLSHAVMLPDSRNAAVKMFLATNRQWLLWIDTDMGFPPDLAEVLHGVADADEIPMVGALCFSYLKAQRDGLGGFRNEVYPTMYTFGADANNQHRFTHLSEYPDNTVVQVAATGSAAILIHRSVFERIADKYGQRWYEMVRDDEADPIGEDFTFCLRAGAVGIDVYVHTGVKTTHHKEIHVSETDFQALPVAVPQTPEHEQLPIEVHIGASLQSLADEAHVSTEDAGHGVSGAVMLKLPEDLERYRAIIRATHPEVIVETGSYEGASARWFLDTMHEANPSKKHEVISVDIDQCNETEVYTDRGRVTFLQGDSVDPATVETITALARGRRTMVVLDSDHSAMHVAREINLYGPLVSQGCYLVVEDTIFGLAPAELRAAHIPGQLGSPLDAVAHTVATDESFSRDLGVERMSAISHHPAGFWVKVGQ